MRVLIVADNLLTRAGLAALLMTQQEVDIVGQAAGGEALGDDLDLYRPDVAAYDLGYDPARAAALFPLLGDLPFVALLPTPDATALAPYLPTESAYGLMLRDGTPGALARALRAVCDGLIVLDRAVAPSLIAAPPALLDDGAPAEALTPRENEVLQLLAEGLPNKLIAARLGISANTVKFHINAILGKLNAQSRTEAVVQATRRGWVML